MKKLALFLVAAMMIFTLAIPASAAVEFTGSVRAETGAYCGAHYG